MSAKEAFEKRKTRIEYIRHFYNSQAEKFSIKLSGNEDDNFLWEEYVICPDEKLTPEAMLRKRELMIYFLLKDLPDLPNYRLF